MVREVAKSIKGWLDEDTKVLCILGGPFVGKTWLATNILNLEKNKKLVVEDDVNSYDEFTEIIKNMDSDKRYVIIGRLLIENCKKKLDAARVGIDIRYVYVMPLNFKEFRETIPQKYKISQMNMLKIYIQVGGLPEAVNVFLDSEDMDAVNKCHQYLFYRIKQELRIKENRIIEAVINQEINDSTGFSFRGISPGARERDYEEDLKLLISKGLIYRLNRLNTCENIKVRKCKYIFYDMGLWSTMHGINTSILLGLKWDLREDILNGFYLRELIYYMCGKGYKLMYWEKHRGKAKLSIIVEKCLENKKIYIPVVIAKNEKFISRSVQSFKKEYENVVPLYIRNLREQAIEDGESLCNTLSNI